MKYLKSNSIEFDWVEVRESPPSYFDLKHVLETAGVELKKLFNVSGVEYRSLNMKEKLPQMTEKEALTVLSQNGHLVKRPLLISKDVCLVGFKESEWDRLL